MIIEINNDSIKCDSYEIFKENINKIFSLDSAEVWISENGGQGDLPCLGILINNDEYVINYFGDDESDFVSVGDENDEREVSFCDGAYDVAGYQIISKDNALERVMYFYREKNISHVLLWDEL